jgi:hypothetical protein
MQHPTQALQFDSARFIVRRYLVCNTSARTIFLANAALVLRDSAYCDMTRYGVFNFPPWGLIKQLNARVAFMIECG